MINKFKEKAALGTDLLEKQLPVVKDYFQKKMGPKMAEIAKDDAKLAIAFKQVYMFLPMPVRLLLSEDKFIAYCIQNKHKFIESKAA